DVRREVSADNLARSEMLRLEQLAMSVVAFLHPLDHDAVGAARAVVSDAAEVKARIHRLGLATELPAQNGPARPRDVDDRDLGSPNRPARFTRHLAGRSGASDRRSANADQLVAEVD